MKPTAQFSGISSQYQIGIIFGVIFCVLVNISQAGYYLLSIGARSSAWEAGILFGLSLALIYGGILSSKTLGHLLARQGPLLLILQGMAVLLMITCFSVLTTALSIDSGASRSIQSEAYSSDRAIGLSQQLKSAQATVDSLQVQADGLPDSFRTRKAQILAQKQEAQRDVMSLNRMLQAAGNSESAVGTSITALETQLGISNLTLKGGIFIGVAIDLLQWFLVASLSYLTVSRREFGAKKEGRPTQAKKPQLKTVKTQGS